MPLLSEMFPGRFLRQDDVDPPVEVTIVEVKQADIAQEGDYPRFEWVVIYEEFQKPMILNWVNSSIIADILGSEDTQQWIGRKLILYRDPYVFHEGRMVGAIRMRRAPRQRKPKEGLHAA